MKRIGKALLRVQIHPYFQAAARVYDEEAADRLMAFFKAESRGEKVAALTRLLLESVRMMSARSREDIVNSLGLRVVEDLHYLQVNSLFRRQQTAVSDVWVNPIMVKTSPTFPGVYLIHKEDAEYDEDIVAVSDEAAYQRVVDALFGDLWAQGNHLTLGKPVRSSLPVDAPRDSRQRYPSNYPLFPTPPAGRYVGSPDPQTTAADLAEGETILLIGASGCGKTTFARRLADALPFVATTLTVTGNYVDDALEVARFLQPDMLIIDDIPLNQGVNNDLLALLENCRQFVKIVVLTFMSDEPAEDYLKPGGLYWPGMRPGRIDRIIPINRPDEGQRSEILAAYLPEVSSNLISQMAAKTEGMTGAYLQALAADVKRLGESCWERRLAYLTYQMPVTDRY